MISEWSESVVADSVNGIDSRSPFCLQNVTASRGKRKGVAVSQILIVIMILTPNCDNDIDSQSPVFKMMSVVERNGRELLLSLILNVII